MSGCFVLPVTQKKTDFEFHVSCVKFVCIHVTFQPRKRVGQKAINYFLLCYDRKLNKQAYRFIPLANDPCKIMRITLCKAHCRVGFSKRQFHDFANSIKRSRFAILFLYYKKISLVSAKESCVVCHK